MTEMTVRRLKPAEYFDADTISRTCFHERFSGDEAAERAKKAEEREDWGAFDGDMLAAHIINNHFRANLNAGVVSMGGIGAVSTLPEYRHSGAIRQIFEKLLSAAFARGEVISGLYPFKHAFYRKFGYETVAHCNSFVLRPAMLKEYVHIGPITQYKAGQDAKPYTDLHNCFARRYNLSILREENQMRRFLCDRPLAERRFAYLLGDCDADTSAYLSFTDRRDDPQAVLIVNDLAWRNPLQLNGILGFLHCFEADYGAIELDLPTDVNLKLLLPDPYEMLAAKLGGSYMMRAINVREALKTLCPDMRESFTLAVYGDQQIPQNNGAWRVSGNGVTDYVGTPDAEMSLLAFNQLICGALSLEGASYRCDIRVSANAGILSKVFTVKPIFVTDRF